MKTPAKILTGLLLGASALAAGSVFAQNATPPAPPPAVQQGTPGPGPADMPGPDGMNGGPGMNDGQMGQADDGWGWWGHSRHHGWGHGQGNDGRWGWNGGDGDSADNGGDDGYNGRMGRGHGRHGMMRGGMMLDANNDGVIGEEEAATLADRFFMRLDDNNDGTLSEAEFTTRGGRGEHRGMHRGMGWRAWFGLSQDEADAVAKVRKDKFAALDTDKNASLSKAEFFADAKTRLAALDSDKDGKVTVWEFRAQSAN